MKISDLPKIEVSFIISGENFDLEKFSREIGLMPTKIRTMDDWPEAIKNNMNLPKELRPRCVWKISQSESMCRDIEIPLEKIISQLERKEQKIIESCERNDLKKMVEIVIHAETMELPQIVLSLHTMSFLGRLGAEVGFDIYVY